MADKKPEVKPVVEAVKPLPKPVVTKYRKEELVEAAKAAFGTDKIVVKAALKMDGKEEYTMEEAKAVVDKFKTKEVKH